MIIRYGASSFTFTDELSEEIRLNHPQPLVISLNKDNLEDVKGYILHVRSRRGKE